MIRLKELPERWVDGTRVGGNLPQCPFETPTETGRATYHGTKVALVNGSTCRKFCKHFKGREQTAEGDNFKVKCEHP